MLAPSKVVIVTVRLVNLCWMGRRGDHPVKILRLKIFMIAGSPVNIIIIKIHKHFTNEKHLIYLI